MWHAVFENVLWVQTYSYRQTKTQTDTYFTETYQVLILYLLTAFFLPRCIECNAVLAIVKPCLYVCPSVCPSHACIVTERTKVLSTFLHRIWKIDHPSLLTRRIVGGNVPLKFWVKLTHPLRKRRFSIDFTRSASRLIPNKKSSIITNRKSTTRFQMSLRWTAYVDPKPPKGAQKRKLAIFPLKVHFSRRKSAAKCLCETFSGKVVRHWLAYLVSSRA